jgi:hypothetical protein
MGLSATFLYLGQVIEKYEALPLATNITEQNRT